MKYEDLTRMYWDINHTIIIVNATCTGEITDELLDALHNLNWCLSTINEELRQLESE